MTKKKQFDISMSKRDNQKYMKTLLGVQLKKNTHPALFTLYTIQEMRSQNFRYLSAVIYGRAFSSQSASWELFFRHNTCSTSYVLHYMLA